MSQLTCYYYAFMIRSRRSPGRSGSSRRRFFGLAVVSQAISIFFSWNDDKYWILTLASLLFPAPACSASSRRASLGTSSRAIEE